MKASCFIELLGARIKLPYIFFSINKVEVTSHIGNRALNPAKLWGFLSQFFKSLLSCNHYWLVARRQDVHRGTYVNEGFYPRMQSNFDNSMSLFLDIEYCETLLSASDPNFFVVDSSTGASESKRHIWQPNPAIRVKTIHFDRILRRGVPSASQYIYTFVYKN